MQAGLRAVERKQLPHMLCVANMLLYGIDQREVSSRFASKVAKRKPETIT